MCQVLIGFWVPFRPHPQEPFISQDAQQTPQHQKKKKKMPEMDNFTGCIQSCLDLFFFVSPVSEMLFFPLLCHHLSPLPHQPVGKDVCLAFPWHNLISGKCISDADSIFLGHTFEILVD